jgi:AraC-like DNA-binding protein
LNETDIHPPGYREFAPPMELRGALACFWMRVTDAGRPETAQVLPDGCSDLMWRSGRGAFVAGPDTGPAPAAVPADAITVGVRFLPGAGGPALGIPLAELRDSRVQADELWPELTERLAPELTPREALSGLVAVAARLVSASPPDRAVRAAARSLADPRSRVEPLADDLGLSERQLRRRFHATVGYGPKTLQRVLRFRRLLEGIDGASGDPDFARLAFDTGYADQAHMTRDCTRLAGLSPAALARVRA